MPCCSSDCYPFYCYSLPFYSRGLPSLALLLPAGRMEPFPHILGSHDRFFGRLHRAYHHAAQRQAVPPGPQETIAVSPCLTLQPSDSSAVQVRFVCLTSEQGWHRLVTKTDVVLAPKPTSPCKFDSLPGSLSSSQAVSRPPRQYLVLPGSLSSSSPRRP